MPGRLAGALRKKVVPLVLALVVIGAGTVGASAYAAKNRTQDQWHILSVVGAKQEKWNWCGPGAAQILLSAFGVSKNDATQRKLADGMNTDSYGFSIPENVANAVNIALGRWAAPKTNIRYTNHPRTGVGQLYTFSKKAINEGAPVIITVKPGNLWWKNASALTAHYLVIYGWNDAWYDPKTKKTQKAYLVRDPSDNSIHHMAAVDWGSANNGANAGYINGDVIVPKNVI
ncbi:C39 family peptidase [Dactylosporangium fulvum]|uniref:C39 family peptidase n=1 Tax=Dactylosporangium fulvum TaxID=53359 RepID=A0ABY5VV03_9ACTN|nr:C39 family peptidase [Dactylosporangium fulvum]UWP81588.1 C39 family peptidase [Dactylosporangium fulvum]